MTTRAAHLATALTMAVAVVTGVPALAAADNLGSADRSTDRSTQPSAGSSTGDSRTPVLPGKLKGRAALKALGTKLASVARANDLSAARLTSVLTEDHTAWVSREGRLFYQEDAPVETTTTPTTAAATVAPAYPTTQTFSLHSNPSATRKVFLDFNGATVQNTAWNGTGTGDIANGTHIGFDTDGKPTTFSSAEHGFVQQVWRQVSESYSPYDVDVTTADPGLSGITRSTSSDTTYGTEVLITSSPTPRAQVCGGCLGVAFVGTFDIVSSSAYYQPAWVFAYDADFDPMVVAQAAVHETGHTLGLQHDGTATQDYYSGTSAWGPIMGSSRTRAVSQFSIGEYAGASNREDDLAIISSNGLPLRVDDHGSSVEGADMLGAEPAYDVSGVIGTRTDTDVFAISLPCLSTLTVSATGIGAQSVLDLKLEVLNPEGIAVQTASPTSSWGGSPPMSNGMNAAVSVPSATGQYYLRVDGVANGNPAGSGWSDYGSLGQYRLTATGCPTPTPTPTPTPAPTPATKPSAPVISTGSSGANGGTSTAVARWAPPTSTGGAPITKYRVRAQRLDSQNKVVGTYSSSYQQPTARALTMNLAQGRYVFAVTAYNRIGVSPWSHTSRGVYAR